MLGIHETFKIHLSKYNKCNFIVSSFYHTPFKSYGPDYNRTTDIEDRFWTCGQFANQATILDLHAIKSRYCIKYDRLMLVNVLMKFQKKITEIVRVVDTEIKFC